MRSLRRAGIDFLSTDKLKYHFLIARIVVHKSAHFANWRGYTRLVGVVEGEAHSSQIHADMAYSRVGFEALRIVVAAVVEQEGRNLVDLSAVDLTRPGIVLLRDVDHANDHRRVTGPFQSTLNTVDFTAVVADPSQTG